MNIDLDDPFPRRRGSVRNAYGAVIFERLISGHFVRSGREIVISSEPPFQNGSLAKKQQIDLEPVISSLVPSQITPREYFDLINIEIDSRLSITDALPATEWDSSRRQFLFPRDTTTPFWVWGLLVLSRLGISALSRGGGRAPLGLQLLLRLERTRHDHHEISLWILKGPKFRLEETEVRRRWPDMTWREVEEHFVASGELEALPFRGKRADDDVNLRWKDGDGKIWEELVEKKIDGYVVTARLARVGDPSRNDTKLSVMLE